MFISKGTPLFDFSDLVVMDDGDYDPDELVRFCTVSDVYTQAGSLKAAFVATGIPKG